MRELPPIGKTKADKKLVFEKKGEEREKGKRKLEAGCEKSWFTDGDEGKITPDGGRVRRNVGEASKKMSQNQ